MKWSTVYLHLKSYDIDVYSPGQKTGTCDSKYVVVRDAGQNSMAETRKLGYSIIDLILFVPLTQYSQIEGYKEEIKSYMKELDSIKATGLETPVMIDESVNGYTVSVEYQILKRL